MVVPLALPVDFSSLSLVKKKSQQCHVVEVWRWRLGLQLLFGLLLHVAPVTQLLSTPVTATHLP